MTDKNKKDAVTYHKLNRENTREYNKKYRIENKEKIKIQRERYRERNKEELILKNKEWRDNNLEKVKEYNNKKSIIYKNRPKENNCKVCNISCADGFCGEICRRKFQSERQLGENNPNWKDKIEKVCEGCGIIFFVQPCFKYRRCCSNECKGILKIGDNNHNWKNGATALNHKIRDLRENKKWRTSIFERDKYTCVVCGKVGGYMEAHHINSFSDIILRNNINSIEDAKLCKELWNINNGVTVCLDCHDLIDEYRNTGNK